MGTRNTARGARARASASDDAAGAEAARTRLGVLNELAPYQAITAGSTAILAAITLSGHVAGGELLIWVAGVLIINCLSLIVLDRLTGPDSRLGGRPGLWLASADSAVRAAAWVALPVHVFASVPGPAKIALAGLTACTALAGIALAALPAAVLAWVAIPAGAILWMLYHDSVQLPLDVMLVPLVFASILLFGLFRLGRLSIDRIRTTALLEGRNRNTALLLEEYEHRGIGWLWETDCHHRLLYVSPQIGLLLGRPSTSLKEHTFPSIFGGNLILSNHLQKMERFDKAELEITAGNGTHWVSVSGSPKFSGNGTFEGFRGTGLDITEIKQSNDRLVNLANIDGLTGLPNRNHVRALIEEGLKKAQESFGQCGVLFLDLDGFKPVNDIYGHSKGDALLKAVAGRLVHATQGYGQAGRFGGDEFVVIMPNIDGRKSLEYFASQLIQIVSETFLIDNTQINVGCSIGGAMGPSDGATAEDLLKRADLALYNAKDDGRGRYRHFDLDLQKRIDHRIDMEKALREALAQKQFSLNYQPIVSATSQKVAGFEALLRWHHPVKGWVSPVDFVPVAEEAGLINEIGEWVLRTACRDAAQWPSDLIVSVNVSPVQLLSVALPHVVGDALDKARLPPNRLELEVTESIFLTDADGSLEVLKRIQAQGVKIALDDFGTGYSSLGYLNKAIFNKLKIDRSFVRDAGKKKEAVLIVQAIVALANSFQMTITAEGVETADELKLMRDLGCHQIQGYLFSKPVPYQKTFELLGAKQDSPARVAS